MLLILSYCNFNTMSTLLMEYFVKKQKEGVKGENDRLFKRENKYYTKENDLIF